MTNPLDMPIGRQNRAAKKAGMTLEQWREAMASQQKKSAPDLYFQTAGPDAAGEVAE